MCEHMRGLGDDRSIKKKQPSKKKVKATTINEKTLYQIVEDVCLFLIKQVISSVGKYHDYESELAKPEYERLTEVYSLNLTRSGF